MSINDVFYRTCDRCKEKIFLAKNYIDKLKELKKINEYDEIYENYNFLCSECFNILKHKQCSFCKVKIDVIKDNYIEKISQLKNTSAYKPEYEKLKRLCLQCWIILKTKECCVCGLKIDIVEENQSIELSNLKKVGNYKTDLDHINCLCVECFNEIKNIPCSLCGNDFNAYENKKNELLENLTEHNVDLPRVNNSRRICPSCYQKIKHIQCSICEVAFESEFDMAQIHSENKQIKKLLSPYSPYCFKSIKSMCPKCYKQIKTASKEVAKNINNWVDGVRAERIQGYKTVKKLGRVEQKSKFCSEPADVEEHLKRYSAQLGGNGFVKFYYKENKERHAKRVLGGYSENNNPYYRTEYSETSWFTGYATAVYVEALREETSPRSTSLPSKRRDIRLVVLDGLNICYWSSSDANSPNILILISLCIGLAEDGLPFFCFFDANTPHVLREQVGEEAEKIYKELFFGDLANYFVEIPGRKQADAFVLQKANCDGGHIISNDQFRDFNDQYVWLRSEDRLLKGTVVDDHLLIPDLQFDCRIRKDLTRALAALRKALKE